MRSSIFRFGAMIVGATAAMLISGGLGGVAFATTGDPASPPRPAPYPGADSTVPSQTLATDGGTAPALASSCTPYVDGDHAHESSGDVSAHGWWYRNDCDNQKTTVTIKLYEYFDDGQWHWQATGTKKVWPGGGSANRAVARQTCDGVAHVGWRSLISIPSPGGGASAYTPAQNLVCSAPYIPGT
jgi:hypothetical protein